MKSVRMRAFVMDTKKRGFLKGLGAASFAAASATTMPVHAASLKQAYSGVNAGDSGLRSDTSEDQSNLFQQILNMAAREDKPVFLSPGHYRMSNITLPGRTRIVGVPGASKLVYTGGNHFLMANNASHIELNGVLLDGGLMPMKEYAGANLRVNKTGHVIIDNCVFENSSQTGVEIDHSSGRLEDSTITNAAGNAGFFGLENKGLLITGNVIEDCANAGIMIYRWQRGEDNTIVSSNRIRRIAAVKGGTGPWGNGINTYQADSALITGNHVSDCAFSAIRSNSCNNIQITSNTCLRAGETSIYSEFAFQGALISSNVIDGGARGVSIVNLDKGGRLAVCSNNLIRNIHETAPYYDANHLFGNGISAEADIAITGNVIENAARFGIMLGWGNYLKNVVAGSNVIRKTKTGVYVSVVEGTGTAAITGNSISEVTEGGIVGFRWKEAVTGDLAKSGAGKYKNLTIENNSLSY